MVMKSRATKSYPRHTPKAVLGQLAGSITPTATVHIHVHIHVSAHLIEPGAIAVTRARAVHRVHLIKRPTPKTVLLGQSCLICARRKRLTGWSEG
jgi:hypothetical protein